MLCSEHITFEQLLLTKFKKKLETLLFCTTHVFCFFVIKTFQKLVVNNKSVPVWNQLQT